MSRDSGRRFCRRNVQCATTRAPIAHSVIGALAHDYNPCPRRGLPIVVRTESGFEFDSFAELGVERPVKPAGWVCPSATK